MEQTLEHHIKGYELRERLGAGGFGAVYRAFQSTVGREVAIKVILPGIANHPDFIRRFETEAQVIARLEHLHIVPLYDYWRDSEGAYLVMRWLKGGSLRDALENGTFDLDSTVLLMDQITSALDVAHRNGIIHRDLKPANILLDEDGNAYLADFGIAKDLTTASGSNTAEDVIVGSLDYISPEQARSEPVTPRTDIYSLGVVLYETLTGQHPFPNLTPVERLYKHLNEHLPLISDPTIPESVNTVIQKATAKNPAGRYDDALEMANAFRQAAALSGNQSTDDPTEILTLREHEILLLLIQGLSNKEIAHKLTFTHGTVKWYINQIYKKLHVRSRVQAIVRARELNLISTSSVPDDLPTVLGALPIPTDEFQPINPYKGLRAFKVADHEDFFGQEKLITKLLHRLAESGENTRFMAVIGPSGSGKSSLVKAGLIPALWRGELPGSERWFMAEMLPGSHPLDELEIALMRVAANQAENLSEQLARDERGLQRVSKLILPDDDSDLVLIIDQFEEVFTLVEDEAARIHFLNLIHAAVTDPRSRVRVIITLRADFYDRPLHYPEFGELIRSRMETILPLSAEGLERAIVRPAERVGVSFEQGLAASIIQEIHYQPGALPLLQYALTELFEQRHGRVLTHEVYQSIGRTTGALAKRAEQIYAELSSHLQEAARQMFLRLVTLGEGVEDTRRRVTRSELLAITSDTDMMDEVIDTFAAYRLLSLDHDPSTRTPTVEVAHEAILREWERLRNWLNECRDEIRLQRQLAHAAQEWRDSKQDVSFLLHGSRLEQLETWAQSTGLALTEREQGYLQSSLDERAQQGVLEQKRQAHEIRLEQRSRNFLRGLVVVFAAAALIAVGLSIFAFTQRQKARDNAVSAQDNAAIAEHNAAESQNLALISGSQAALANGNTDGAIALALEAVTLDSSSARAQVALSEAAYAPGTIRTFVGHTNEVDGLALSPDGQTVLSASHDNSVILWDIQTGEIIRRFEGHTGSATSVAFLPDGLSAISASEDKTMIQWNLQSGEIIQRFEGQADQIWAFTISPDGLYAVSGGSAGNIILWDIQTGDMIRQFEADIFGVQSLEFSSDGGKLLSSAFMGSVILWDVETGEIIRRFEGHSGIAYTAIFNPDNRTILSAADDGMMILWDIETGEIIRRFYEEGAASIMDAVFSADGRTILSGGAGGLVLWNVETAQPISRLRGHGGLIAAVLFNPDERTALSASADGTLRLWGLEDGQVLQRLTGVTMDGWINALATSPDGQTALAAWSPPTYPDPSAFIIRWEVGTGEEIYRSNITDYVEGSVGAWINSITISPDGRTALLAIDNRELPAEVVMLDVVTGEIIHHFSGHPTGIRSVAFSPDGRTAASVGHQGIIILWDVATGDEIRRFKGYEGDDPFGNEWEYVGFSPDGTMLITTHISNIIVLWDITTGEEIRHFDGHLGHSWNILFSADGKQAFSGSPDKTAILWDVASGSILHRFSDHSAGVLFVDMTSDGQFGISGSDDHTVTLWNLQTGDLIRRYNGVSVQIPLFAPDNRTMFASIWPNQIEVWRIDVTLDELLDWTRANRFIPHLTCDERELYRLEPLCSDNIAGI